MNVKILNRYLTATQCPRQSDIIVFRSEVHYFPIICNAVSRNAAQMCSTAARCVLHVL